MIEAVAPTTRPEDAARFVRAFAEGWAGPHLERLMDLLHPNVRLVQPLFPPSTGHEAVEATFFRPLVRFLPDVRLEVDRWSAAGDTLMIVGRASSEVVSTIAHAIR